MNAAPATLHRPSPAARLFPHLSPVGEAGGSLQGAGIAYLGKNYINLALSRYDQNRIPETELADYLDTKVRNLPKLESYLAKKTSWMYIFDTSLLSSLFRNFYRSRFPTLWKGFDDLVADGRVTSTREGRRELDRYAHSIVVTLEEERPDGARFPTFVGTSAFPG